MLECWSTKAKTEGWQRRETAHTICCSGVFFILWAEEIHLEALLRCREVQGWVADGSWALHWWPEQRKLMDAGRPGCGVAGDALTSPCVTTAIPTTVCFQSSLSLGRQTGWEQTLEVTAHVNRDAVLLAEIIFTDSNTAWLYHNSCPLQFWAAKC